MWSCYSSYNTPKASLDCVINEINICLNNKKKGVDYKVKTIRVDERNVAVQLWDTAGKTRSTFLILGIFYFLIILFLKIQARKGFVP